MKHLLILFLLLGTTVQAQIIGVVASNQGSSSGQVNLCENGTFDGNSTTDWSFGSGWAVANNQLEGTATTALATYTFPNHTLVSGDDYEVTFDMVGVTSGGVRIRLGGSTGNGSFTTVGTHTITITAEASGNYLRFDDTTGAFTGEIDNIIVYKL